MPYKNLEINLPNYNPQHTVRTEQVYKGFSTVDQNNYGSKLFDFDLIKQDLLNHFNTRKGSRLMNPTFGTIIWELLMDPMTEEIRNLLQQDITRIVNFDPRVYPLQIDIREYEQGFLVELTLQMKSTNQTTRMRLAFDQSLGLVEQ